MADRLDELRAALLSRAVEVVGLSEMEGGAMRSAPIPEDLRARLSAYLVP